MLRAGAELILRLLALPRPVLGVCTGHAYPMGAFLMLSADVRFAVAGEWRIGMNEVAIGLTVPGFAVELARHRLTPAGFERSPRPWLRSFQPPLPADGARLADAQDAGLRRRNLR